jgi:hypothetical protein
MSSRPPALAVLAVVLVVAPAALTAQPDSTPAAAPAEVAAGDPPELAAAYEAAFAALAAGDLDGAIAALDDVALRSVEPERRAAARELGRLARDLRARRVRLVVGDAPPGAMPALRALPEDDRPGAGRIEVVVLSTIAGFYSGFVLLDIFDVDDFRGGTALVTATTAVGFLASLYGTAGRDITSGMGAAYGSGVLLGAANGLLLASPLGIESSEGFLSLGLAGAALGGASMLVLSDRVRPTVGQVSLASTTSVMGLATVGLGMAIIQPDDIDPDTLLLLLAGGLDVGAAAGAGVARNLTWSKGRARLVSLGAFLGALGGFGGTAIAFGEPESNGEARLMAGAVLGGMWGGFALAIHLTRNLEPDPRFAEGAAPSFAVVPTMVGDGGSGIAVAGTF